MFRSICKPDLRSFKNISKSKISRNRTKNVRKLHLEENIIKLVDINDTNESVSAPFLYYLH